MTLTTLPLMVTVPVPLLVMVAPPPVVTETVPPVAVSVVLRLPLSASLTWMALLLALLNTSVAFSLTLCVPGTVLTGAWLCATW